MAAPRDRVLNALPGICRVFVLCLWALSKLLAWRTQTGQSFLHPDAYYILYFVSYILYLISCILYFISCILYLISLSCILYLYLVSYILYLISYILYLVFQSEALALMAVRPCSYASKTLVFFFLPFDVAKVRKILTYPKFFSNYFYKIFIASHDALRVAALQLKTQSRGRSKFHPTLYYIILLYNIK